MSSDIVKQRKQILISKKHETWSDIARRIAHEIKNPLTPIQLSSERLEKSIKKINGNNSDIDECIQIIRRQVNEIGLLVDEFSNFARLPNPKFQDENICDIIVKIINEYKSTYPSIIFDFKLQKEKSNLNIDKSQISRVFQNIVINSIQSIKEANNKFGNILISTHENDINFITIIKDNGGGLKYEKDDLLKPYFTTKKKSGGSGLGLSIVEKILFDHNAEFSIDNRTDGTNGAEVIIKFEK